MPYLTFDDLLTPHSTNKVISRPSEPVLSSVTTTCSGTPPQTSLSPTQISQQSDPKALSESHNVMLNQATTLERLIHYHPSTTLQYPETTSSPNSQIGHLFTVTKGSDIYNPLRDVAYSLGPPKGTRKPVYVFPLADSNGCAVPCARIFTTCQGLKMCPFSDPQLVRRPHLQATSEALHQQLQQDRSLVVEPTPEQYFQKTLSLWVAIRDGGCPYPAQELTSYTGYSYIVYVWLLFLPLYQFSLSFGLLRSCEHYNSQSLKKHFVNRSITDGPYNVDYLFALLNDDHQTILYWEQYAKHHGYGPLVPCNHVQNVTSVKVNSHTHCSPKDLTMYMTEMVALSCNAKFTAYIPLPEYRDQCPHTLVVCHSPHNHPIPLPTTTPEPIRQSLKTMLLSLEQELPDITPRRLLQHPLFWSYLAVQIPDMPLPMATDLHLAIVMQYPNGTGWNGIKSLLDIQNRTVPSKEHYIRHIEEMPWESLNDPDPGPLADDHGSFRLILCMSPSCSHDLLHAEYVESDISFKRVAGYKEFKLVGFDYIAKTGVVYCCALLNCQSAQAHQRLFDKIRQIVYLDTSKWLQYRHLHSPSLHERRGILHWGVDQDGGQARGLGLHLQAIAQKEIPLSQRDLHEPHRYLHELSEYEHVHRLLHLCWVHVERNIKKAKVTDEVKTIMRSLMCITHKNFDSAVYKIQVLGKTTGTNWVQDKIRSKFAFEAMCWEKSKLPLDIWKAGNSHTNLAEGLHADVNHEGIQCSLVGGIRCGQHFDMMRMKSQQVLLLLLII
ncbi:uncharacterized protein EV420DRAFT_1280541 [Desarmillaria tabescens]|uniref:Uncharacterized protein n=1 Tax=Armillaria tabescens TaxID=1929756 RepID=A0AA39J934_ARMTA|nr:uncharacterized protein EV420DRAFT_1280541 [Desarmillaria tabescens]KAK0437715.1 hypothetical protein EV420DRAFT_1280541 [Desarmillaria tabescens]